jgi:hypothetical protein
MYVGCDVYEIQCQKGQQQSFQETAKVRDFALCVCAECKERWCCGFAYRLAFACLHRARTSMDVSC